ncbi:MAG: L,D-transpeptidase [Actinomycetia bacterium]|nr:L,D-transpeptidase [Actinomycetes bacterium]MCH9787484.1 L,D-transpeptidase [Actinomycetes bacterium]
MTSLGAPISRRLRSAAAVAVVFGVLAAASPGAVVADESADTDSVESTSSPSASPTVDPNADLGSEPSVDPTPEAVPDPSVPPPDAALPFRPVLIAVTPADASAIATYLPVDDPSVTGYQISPDGYLWFDCPDVSGTCGLSSLTNGREYRVSMRSSGPTGQSPPSGPIATIPTASDWAKPKVLPKPRKRVTATFEAAGNGLGVSGSRVKLGVGTLPRLRFSKNITNKAAVERHLQVAATTPSGRTVNVPGAWGWISDETVVFRPKNYWPGNSTIRITSTVNDTVLGKSGKKYLVGSKALRKTYVFRTDRSLIATVDGAKKTMTVHVNGKKRKNFKVSLGKSGWETRNGAKVISTDKEDNKVYRSSSLGLDPEVEFYELPSKWNTRLTPSGEFLHTASWAYGRLGRYNGSHGCTNMFEDDAKWIFDNTIPGDVVNYIKTGGDMMEAWNGPGGLWNIPWNRWLKKSALSSASGKADTTSDDGSVDDVRPDGA